MPAGTLELPPLAEDMPELADRFVLVGAEIRLHHHPGAAPVGPAVLAVAVRAGQQRAMDDLDVILYLGPGTAGARPMPGSSLSS